MLGAFRLQTIAMVAAMASGMSGLTVLPAASAAYRASKGFPAAGGQNYGRYWSRRTVAQHKRAASKKRNVARNRAAHR